MDAKSSTAVGGKSATGLQQFKRFSLPKSARLRKGRAFRFVAKYGKAYKTAHCCIYFAKRNKGETKLGMTVSKRCGEAVVRNSLKRQIREVFRTLRPSLPQGLWLNVTLYPSASSLSPSLFRQELLQGFSGLGFECIL